MRSDLNDIDDCHEFEICLVRLSWGYSKDIRPAILLNTGAGISAVPLLAHLQLRTSKDFSIRIDDPDFDATGLAKESYAQENATRDIALSDIVKSIGRLQGFLLLEFKKWYGLD